MSHLSIPKKLITKNPLPKITISLSLSLSPILPSPTDATTTHERLSLSFPYLNTKKNQLMDAKSASTYSPNPTRKTKPPIFADPDWSRPDSRGFHHCRPAFFRTGAVNSASGSAYAEFGNTKVIVSVFGPRESKKAMMFSDIGRLNCNVSYTTFATPVRGQGSDHKEHSSMLHKALEGAIILESFPKTTVDVFALVLESGGSDLPVVITCASLALADAGIMMYDLVTSVSVSCLGKNLLIDPILEEESYQDGSLTIACMRSRYEVTQLTITGEWSTPNINEAMQLCLDACSKLGNIMRSCLKETASASQE
ncbi:RNase_PH domain-containing protein/RNase_PH_C domain-containing protein [Cephalotus follicularis]|uniref:RNase_PH domain-containing protein/RNase_PH_C domain-containing protein n=1 Tax=Cephalotus follicularis TaxID=3775 RepID=A0A1Q3C6Z8_CEPFO|nr:RNase_PH domain-containing protein/RNase_PH_C domain-containing protein [Cephalotus follicularis]